MNVTFIGLGIMGSRMAMHLLEHKVNLTVFNRDTSKAKQLVNVGATLATDAHSAVKDADVVFSMLANPEAVESVFLNDTGLMSAMKKGAIWADCSTVNPSFSIRCGEWAAKHNIHFLDSPVSGSKPQAQNAELLFLVGGTSETLSRVQALMEMMGKKVLHVGETGKGSALKLVINSLLAHSMLAFSEGVHLGKSLGIDTNFLLDLLPSLPVVAPFTKFKVENIKTGDYEPHFPLELMQKDLHLAAMTAFEQGLALPLTNCTKEVFAQAKQSGMGRLDMSAIYKFTEANK